MSDIAWAKDAIRDAFPEKLGPGKVRMQAAFEFLKKRKEPWTFRRVRSVWEGDKNARLTAHEKDDLKDAQKASFPPSLGRLHRSMSAVDPEFFAEDIAALERMARSIEHRSRALRRAGLHLDE